MWRFRKILLPSQNIWPLLARVRNSTTHLTLVHTKDSNTFHHIQSKVYFQRENNMLSFLSLFCLFLCDFYLICSALVFHEWWKDIGMKALTNFPSILHDGNCTNIVFVEDLRHQESFDAIRHMFLDVMTEEAYTNYLTYITIR